MDRARPSHRLLPQRLRYLFPTRRALETTALLVALGACGGGGDGGGTAPPTPVQTVDLAGVPASGISFVGVPFQLTATPRDVNGAPLTRTVTWSTSHPNVATVSATGLVTPVGVGATEIRATSEMRTGLVILDVRVGVAVPPASAPAPVTTVLFNGAVTVTLPPGATTTTTMLDVRPPLVAPTNPRILAATAFSFGPTATTFVAPMTLTIRYDTTGLSPYPADELRIHRVDASGLTRVPGGSVDTTGRLVTAQINEVGTYAIARAAIPASIAVLSGAGQSAALGQPVPVAPAFIVRDATGVPAPFARVSFSQASGAYAGPYSVVTGEDGIAQAGEWVLGWMPGTNTITAQVEGVNIPTASVTATAVSPPGVNLFVSEAPQAFASGVGFGFPVIVDLTNRNGLDLRQLNVEIQFDTTVFFLWGVFDGTAPWTDDDGDLATITVDSSRAVSDGVIALTGSSGAATTTSFTLAYVVLHFRTNATFTSDVRAVVLDARSAAGASITVTPRNLSVLANPP
jgi:hypothetical protein